jgi:bifunctional DNase/RNase
MRCEDNQSLKDFLAQPKSFTSHEIQNEILQLLSHSILRSIVASVNDSQYFSIIADETTDQSKQEQLSILIIFNQLKIRGFV